MAGQDRSAVAQVAGDPLGRLIAIRNQPPFTALSDAGHKSRKRPKVPGVTLQSVMCQPALDTQMVEVVPHLYRVKRSSAGTRALGSHNRDIITGLVREVYRMPSHSKWESLPTEAINPSTLAIDKLPATDIVDSMLTEDRKMLAAVQRERDRIAVGVDIITRALRKGGRIIFVGAGTSGRLGLLESAEMPPTFGTRHELVLAVVAGGKDAVP